MTAAVSKPRAHDEEFTEADVDDDHCLRDFARDAQIRMLSRRYYYHVLRFPERRKWENERRAKNKAYANAIREMGQAGGPGVTIGSLCNYIEVLAKHRLVLENELLRGEHAIQRAK